jgi:hypothetical protein
LGLKACVVIDSAFQDDPFRHGVQDITTESCKFVVDELVKDSSGSAPCENLSWITVLYSVPIAFVKTANRILNSRDASSDMAQKPNLARIKERHNNRLHSNLEFEHLEILEQAFGRKILQEMY